MSVFASEQLLAAQQAHLNSLLAMANTALEGIQKLTELNLQATKSALAEGREQAIAALDGSDGGSAALAQGASLQPATEKALAYARHVYDIAAGTQAGFAHVAEAHCEQYGRALEAFAETFVKNAPVGTEAATALLQAAANATSGAFGALRQVAHQAREAAVSHLDTAAAAATGTSRSKA
ncbi:hypothetical protein BKK79_33765 [Cupriavidus sp. USMAA2-4]|uniref:TIGR01841 family phasin n=1 Tax=Cupriavidus sp. USMAA2-4 TaxID=876364 RepID=UPI0008A67E32|nr:TIGR01841 family phasin [Cupriavidus sp. USMAA2-4]AOY96517.1 hypothetical protein BKK79_33765 [Cupriavidus sp. USMAA2-4]